MMELNLSSLTLFTLIFGITTACFITNCPPGGKRSMPPSDRYHQKQCTRCGPNGIGTCFGPDICCGPAIGCQFKNRITAVCRTEDYSPHACKIEGKPCGNGIGVCALNSTCCTSDGCFTDKSCELPQFENKMFDGIDSKRSKWSDEVEGRVLL